MKMNSFKLNSGLGIGEDYPVRVNCNSGINSKNDIDKEIYKLEHLFLEESHRPDIIMDLSTIDIDKPIYKYLRENHEVTVGTVPTYFCFDKDKGFDKKLFLDTLNKQIELSVSFFTLHLTADLDLLEYAQKERKIPVTSRGGSLLLADQKLKNTNQNIIIRCLEEIIKLFKKHNIAISLGTTFRPASIFDACDTAHIEETKRQLKYSNYLRSNGIPTIIENIGHITLDKIYTHISLLKKFNAPIMPLGPLPTDLGFDNDHIASSIGASFLGFFNCAHIINSITPSEHLNGDISLKAMIEGVKAAKLSAQIINLALNKIKYDSENNIYTKRAEKYNCLASETGCNRCGHQCPLRMIK